MHLGMKVSSDEPEQSEMFAKYFNHHFSIQGHSISTKEQTQISNLNSFTLDKYFVFDELPKLNTKKDERPSGLLDTQKLCSTVLSTIIDHIQ